MRSSAIVLMVATALLGTACSATRTQRAPGEHVDDAALVMSVKSALIANESTKARDIDVEVNRGVVQLNGFVDSQQQKAEAASIAWKIDGVREVRNNLAVEERPSTVGEVIDDSALTAKVKAALIASEETKAHQINVETKQGVVQLSGFVDDAATKSAATSVAKSVTGVKFVMNDLSIKSY